MNIKTYIIFLSVSIFLCENLSSQNFSAEHLIIICDADMAGTAYVDGKLGYREEKDKDLLITFPVPHNFTDNQWSKKTIKLNSIEVSNSVNGIGNIFQYDSTHKLGYLIEVKKRASAEATEFRQQPLGNNLFIMDFANPSRPKIIDSTETGIMPQVVDLHPQGKMLAVVTGNIEYPEIKLDNDKRIQLFRLENGGKIGKRYDFPIIGFENKLTGVTNVQWHPSGKYLAVNLPSLGKVVFYEVIDTDDQIKLKLYKNTVDAGKFPGSGYFTSDGNFFITNDLNWGVDVEGFFINPPAGLLKSIQFSTKPEEPHKIVSSTPVGQNPESFRLSPNSKTIIVANMEGSGLRWDDERLTKYSSISLVSIDTNTGQLATIQKEKVYGILPQGITFDSTGKLFAVSVFSDFDFTSSQGQIEFWEIDGISVPFLKRTGFKISVPKGPYYLDIIPK